MPLAVLPADGHFAIVTRCGTGEPSATSPTLATSRRRTVRHRHQRGAAHLERMGSLLAIANSKGRGVRLTCAQAASRSSIPTTPSRRISAHVPAGGSHGAAGLEAMPRRAQWHRAMTFVTDFTLVTRGVMTVRLARCRAAQRAQRVAATIIAALEVPLADRGRAAGPCDRSVDRQAAHRRQRRGADRRQPQRQSGLAGRGDRHAGGERRAGTWLVLGDMRELSADESRCMLRRPARARRPVSPACTRWAYQQAACGRVRRRRACVRDARATGRCAGR